MIKKFREYVEHKTIPLQFFTVYPTLEDIEDQFLRLREVIGCVVNINMYKVKNINKIYEPGGRVILSNLPTICQVTFYLPKENNKGGEYISNKKIKEVVNELNTIKERMENMYTSITVDTSDVHGMHAGRRIRFADTRFDIKIKKKFPNHD